MFDHWIDIERLQCLSLRLHSRRPGGKIMRFAFGLCLMASLSSPALAGGFSMHLIPGEKQEARVEQGLEAIDSDGTTVGISVMRENNHARCQKIHPLTNPHRATFFSFHDRGAFVAPLISFALSEPLKLLVPPTIKPPIELLQFAIKFLSRRKRAETRFPLGFTSKSIAHPSPR